MKIVVTGCSGYLGQLLIERLNQEGLGGEDILGLDLAGASLPDSRMRWVRRDVRDQALVRDFEGADLVVHLAFIVETMRDRALMYDVNLGGSRNVLGACERAGVPNVIVASSVAAYGVHGQTVITEQTPLRGDKRSFYAHTKRLVEEEMNVFDARNPGVRLVRLRPSVILGPRCNTWAIASMGTTGGLDTERGIRLPVIHEQDVVDAIWRCIERPVRGAMLLAHREPLTGHDLARLSGTKRRVVPESILTRLAEASFALGLSRMNRDWLALTLSNGFRCDPTVTEDALGWSPRFGAEEALEAALHNARSLDKSARRRASAHIHRLEGTRFPLKNEEASP